jgi:hypothetical protein
MVTAVLIICNTSALSTHHEDSGLDGRKKLAESERTSNASVFRAKCRSASGFGALVLTALVGCSCRVGCLTAKLTGCECVGAAFVVISTGS